MFQHTIQKPSSWALPASKKSPALEPRPFSPRDPAHTAAPVQPIPAAGADRIPSEARPENKTGLPDSLKTGIEVLSGWALDAVRVHYNSPKPAALQALAYTRGAEIHLAPGQERHLPHEAWHVVQQAQGRVKPTLQLKSGTAVNDDRGLEREADRMGARAAQISRGLPPSGPAAAVRPLQRAVVQRVAKAITPSAREHYNDGWGALYGIQDDQTLMDRVEDTKTPGEQSINLGVHFHAGENKRKVCNIKYTNFKKKLVGQKITQEPTSIFHCGPFGPDLKNDEIYQ